MTEGQAVLVTDADGTITLWDDGATALFGWAAADAVGTSLDLIVPERLRARHWEGWRHALSTGELVPDRPVLRVPALHRDGQTLRVTFTVALLRDPASGEVTGVAAVLRAE